MKTKKNKKKNNPELELIVILDNIRSTYNVGAIFRTADGAGVKKIYLCGITPTPDNEKVKKVALGAENYINWEKIASNWRLIEKLKKEDYFLIALEQNKKAKNLFQLKKIKKKKIALIVGNEIKGISKKILKRVDLILEIEMTGEKESLNVSVAFGIAIYYLRNLLYNIS
ncbi:MAG TPA: TrmH family RNA methyltransferase [Candidatus Paceibacterota bacterium]|nr:TrmH family RNA methyltransferase [Candidatus Paceibacterota bacterium]